MKTRNLRPCGGAGWGKLEGALDPWLLGKRSQGSPFNFLGLGMAGRELHPPEGGVAVFGHILWSFIGQCGGCNGCVKRWGCPLFSSFEAMPLLLSISDVLSPPTEWTPDQLKKAWGWRPRPALFKFWLGFLLTFWLWKFALPFLLFGGIQCEGLCLGEKNRWHQASLCCDPRQSSLRQDLSSHWSPL